MAQALPFVGTGRKAAAAPGPPSLAELSLRTLAANSAGLVDLRGMSEDLLVELLRRIMQQGRLDYRLACVFRDAGHEDIREAMESLDLLAAMPTHNAIGSPSCRPR
jgi:hypothetical protein